MGGERDSSSFLRRPRRSRQRTTTSSPLHLGTNRRGRLQSNPEHVEFRWPRFRSFCGPVRTLSVRNTGSDLTENLNKSWGPVKSITTTRKGLESKGDDLTYLRDTDPDQQIYEKYTAPDQIYEGDTRCRLKTGHNEGNTIRRDSRSHFRMLVTWEPYI